MTRIRIAALALVSALSPMVAQSQQDSLAILGYDPNKTDAFDLNGTPGQETLADLKKHYGARLKADNSLCKLPEKAALRQPLKWDCTTWRVERPRYIAFPVDSLSYRVRPDGLVVSETYSVEGACEHVLAAYFNFAQIYEPGKMKQLALMGTPETTQGFIETTTTFKANKYKKFSVNAELKLEFRNKRCSVWHTVQQAD